MNLNNKSNKRKFLLVMGLALALPGTIIGIFFLLYELVRNSIITWNLLLVSLLVVVFYFLILMVKNGLGKKD